MSHLVQLRGQIKAVQTTQKITYAVRLVSMSLYAKLERRNIAHRRYLLSITRLFFSLLKNCESWRSPIFHPADLLDKTPLIIIVGTAKGLCGSLNSNLFRFIEQTLFLQPEQKAKLIVIGQKAINFVKEQELGEVLHSYTELASNNYQSIGEDLADKILKSQDEYSSITFFSNTIKSFFYQVPKKTVLAPLQAQASQESHDENVEEDNKTDIFASTIWEQPQEEIIDTLAHSYYLKAFLTDVLFQAILSEQAARFLAMNSSTTNAEKYLEKLTLQYNKLRQAIITREVSELSSNNAGS